MAEQPVDITALTASMEHAPYGVSIVEIETGPRLRAVYTNLYNARMLGEEPGFGVGHYLDEVMPPHRYQQVLIRYMECVKRREDLSFDDHFDLPTGDIYFNVILTPIQGADNTIRWILATTFDTTSQMQSIREERERQEAIIAHQAAIVAELSTPLLTISEDVVVMPIVGAVDSRRTQQIMESLLTGISQHQASIAIVDITGVSVVDTAVANALIQAAQAVRLLGAEVVLTGIRPEVAQTLVSLGTNLEGVVTRSTLQMGIAYSLDRR
jgi:rsbT co-antagonist protein RsbR